MVVVIAKSVHLRGQQGMIVVIVNSDHLRGQ